MCSYWDLLLSSVQIRIGFTVALIHSGDPDPGRLKWTPTRKKGRNSCFEELDVLSVGLETSSAA
jgi:hypothetical protein